MEALQQIMIISLLLCSVYANTDRYITYTVNYGEGFNLRRDVHMRVVTLVLALRRDTGLNWVLVLPPWPHLYHWKSPGDQSWLQWNQFFDVDELSKIVPCMEFTEYLQQEGHVLDEVLQLQRFEEPFKDGNFIESVEETDSCTGTDPHTQSRIFGYSDIRVKNAQCVFAQGRVSVMATFLKKRLSRRSFLIRNFENLLHESFGGIEYWKIRRSMVYSSTLRDAGNRFMMQTLHYDPGVGNGRDSHYGNRGGGGPFIGAHLRRKDFLESRKNSVPSLEGTVNQLRVLLSDRNLSRVFVASDASSDIDFQRTMSAIGDQVEVFWYKPTSSDIDRYGDGGIAIIDQWILSHAKYFIGTADSTFSYRVREDRQFMGFSVDSTFNDFCGPSHNEHDPYSCPGPVKWLLVEEKKTESKTTRTEL